MYMNAVKTNELLAEALKRVFPYPVDESTSFLNSIRDESIIKAVFECLMLRMPVERLKEMFASGATAPDFNTARNEFLVAMASDQDPYIRKAEAALEKAERVIAENNDLKDFLSTKVASAINELNDNHQKEIRLLNEQIDFFKEQYKAAREQIETLKESNAQKRLSTLEPVQLYPGAISDSGHHGIHVPDLYRKRFRPHSHTWKSMEAFCTELSKNPDLSIAQKGFLLSCLEEGYPVEVISKVMVSTLTLEEMERFIKVYAKRMNGKKFK